MVNSTESLCKKNSTKSNNHQELGNDDNEKKLKCDHPLTSSDGKLVITPEKLTNVLLVSGLTNPSTQSNTSTPAGQWGIVIKNHCNTIEGVQKQIEVVVQKHIFPQLKFIVNPKQMTYLEHHKSVCHLTCFHLNVKLE